MLQERRLSLTRTIVKAPAHTTTVTSKTTYTTMAAGTLSRESHEVIQLSPSESQPNDSASMTQQGKIAAALLKAGIPNPVTWSTQNEVRVIDAPSELEPSAIKQAEDVSRVLQQGAAAEPVRLPSLQQSPCHSVDWKTNLMIWGGPPLTLACIYVLASHFGWL